MEHGGWTYQMVLALCVPLSLALAAAASAFGLSRSVSTALEAISRQPEAADKIQLAMIIGCALIEALTIYVLVIAAILQAKITG